MWELACYRKHLETLYSRQIQEELQPLIGTPIKRVDFTSPSTYRLDVAVIGEDAYGEDRLASFHLECMPGTCGVIISDHTYVQEHLQNRGIATRLMDFKINMAKKRPLSFAQMMCSTVHPDNIPEYAYEERILIRYGFQVVKEFYNTRSGNVVKVWMLDL